MAHRKKKIGAQLVEDEEYQLRYERVAGIDVAKGKADVCTRLPPARDGGRRRQWTRSCLPRDGAAVSTAVTRVSSCGLAVAGACRPVSGSAAARRIARKERWFSCLVCWWLG